jgi:hypothetical protein
VALQENKDAQIEARFQTRDNPIRCVDTFNLGRASRLPVENRQFEKSLRMWMPERRRQIAPQNPLA